MVELIEGWGLSLNSTIVTLPKHLCRFYLQHNTCIFTHSKLTFLPDYVIVIIEHSSNAEVMVRTLEIYLNITIKYLL